MIIITYTGKVVDPWHLDGDYVDIRDIARSLSMQCRFAGHLTSHYNVAQHSMLVASIIEHLHPDNQALQFAALLHDAAEAYLTDLPTPVKEHLPEFKQAEERALREIYHSLGANYLLTKDERVKAADTTALVTEARDFLVTGGVPQISRLAKPLPNHLRALTPRVAEACFLERFERLSP